MARATESAGQRVIRLKSVAARQKVEHELSELRRQRSLAQAWAAERDPAQPLQ
jgi:hypothetical protein